MSGTSRLAKLIETREKQWRTYTDQIVKELSTKVDPAIRRFIAQARGLNSAERFTITSADIMDSNDTEKYPDGILLVWGNITFKEGEIITSDQGNDIALNAIQAQSLSLPTQLDIPLHMVTSKESSEDDIAAFLLGHLEAKTQQMQKLAEEQNQNTAGDSLDNYVYNVELEAAEEVPPLDLDISDFSPADQQLIRISHAKHGNTKQ